jgi:hypothetical protein
MWLRLILVFLAAGAISEGGYWLATHSAELGPEAFSS